MSRFGFDLKEYESSSTRDYSPIPKGEYTIKCTEAESKDTKSGGQMIAATFEVVGDQFDGRKIWNNFNIHNNSEVAQKIGREQVASWARACGKPNATSVDELLERKFKASIDIEKGKDGYADKNRIVGYVMEGNAPAKPKAQVSLMDIEEDEPEAKPAKGDKKKNPWD